MSALLFDDTEIISRYTRAQAIEDGISVDMTAEPFGDLAREAGLKWPIAMTATAFNDFGMSFSCLGAPGARYPPSKLGGILLFKIPMVASG
jgi:hypothetical protein